MQRWDPTSRCPENEIHALRLDSKSGNQWTKTFFFSLFAKSVEGRPLLRVTLSTVTSVSFSFHKKTKRLLWVHGVVSFLFGVNGYPTEQGPLDTPSVARVDARQTLPYFPYLKPKQRHGIYTLPTKTFSLTTMGAGPYNRALPYPVRTDIHPFPRTVSFYRGIWN